MKQSELETLRTQAAKVELPQTVREAVMAEATALDQAEQQPQSRRITRRSFLRVGVAAAAVGVGAFLGLSIFGDEETLPVFDDGSDGATKQRGFVLTAFADEFVPEDGKTFPVKNMITDLGLGPSDIDGMYDAEYWFVIYGKVLGEGDGKMSFELEGPYAQDTLDEDIASEPLITFGANDGEVIVPDHEYYPTTISTLFGTSGVNQFVHPMTIRAHFPMSDALKSAIDNGDRRAELLVARHCFNELLATTTLRITVVYNSGDTYEERYLIEPTNDFEETCGAYIDALVALEEQGFTISKYGVMDLDNITQNEWEFRQKLDAIEDDYWFYTIREIDG